MKKLKIFTPVVLATFLIACGGGEQKAKQTESKTSPKKTEKVEESKAETKEPVEKKVVEITVDATGETMTEIAFEPKTLTIPANSRVKLTLNNKSSAAGMLHNFVLVELGSGQEVATAGISAGKENSFVPDDDRVIAYTEVSDIGETVTVEFDAPAKGSYHYVCTFPGHYPNMIGRLNVE